MSLTFGSICSGIEAASQAWSPIGWRPAFLSEIAPFPRAVLQHHYPEIPLHGDFTTIKAGEYDTIDVLCGGTPCQAFSVAGMRAGLDDDRGNLSLEFLKLAERLQPRWLVWENVPGVLSSNGGRDFGAIVGGMVQLGYGVAWRVLDAQFVRVDGFARAVPQRRRRVVLVGYLGDRRRAQAVLFEQESLQGHTPPRRQTREDLAAGAENRTGDGSHWDGTGVHPSLNQSHNDGAIGYSNQELFSQRGAGLVAKSLLAKHNSSHAADVETLVPEVTGTLNHASGKSVPGDSAQDWNAGMLVPEVAGCLQERDSKGADSDTKPGHLIPIAFNARQDTDVSGEVAGPLNAGEPQDQAIAFSCKDHGGDAATEVAPTMRAMGHDDSHENGGGQLAVAFQQNSRSEVREIDGDGQIAGAVTAEPGVQQQNYVAYDLRGREGGADLEGPHDTASVRAASGGSSRSYVQIPNSVRLLTPRECERLMGFPDDYTLIPYRGRPAEKCPDGPRYKALGNSWAVNVFRWVGQRIDFVDKIS